jgi:hypothetical protein
MVTRAADLLRIHAPALDPDAAAALLRRQAVGPVSPRRLLGHSVEALVGVDLVLAPHWYCRLPVVAETPAGTEHRDAWVIVDGLDGQVLRLSVAPEFDDRDPATLAPAVVLPATLDMAGAADAGRAALRWDVQVRGRQRVAARVEPASAVELGYVPIWLGYFAGAGGALRAAAMHGIEGRPVDGRRVDRLLRALAEATNPSPCPLPNAGRGQGEG